MVAVRTCMVIACSSIDWLLQLPGAVLLIGRAPFVYWGVSNYCALTEVFLLPRIQLCSLHRLSWLLLSYDYCHDYFLVSSMLKLSSLKLSKYTRWILASLGRLVTHQDIWLGLKIVHVHHLEKHLMGQVVKNRINIWKLCERYNMSRSAWTSWNMALWWLPFCFIWTYMLWRMKAIKLRIMYFTGVYFLVWTVEKKFVIGQLIGSVNQT